MADTETLDAPETETRERLTPEERELRKSWLVRVGAPRWGSSWQTPMAEALSAASGREVPRPRVNQWAQGTKPMPRWAALALAQVAQESAEVMRAEAKALQEKSQAILDELGPHPFG